MKRKSFHEKEIMLVLLSSDSQLMRGELGMFPEYFELLTKLINRYQSIRGKHFS